MREHRVPLPRELEAESDVNDLFDASAHRADRAMHSNSLWSRFVGVGAAIAAYHSFSFPTVSTFHRRYSIPSYRFALVEYSLLRRVQAETGP